MTPESALSKILVQGLTGNQGNQLAGIQGNQGYGRIPPKRTLTKFEKREMAPRESPHIPAPVSPPHAYTSPKLRAGIEHHSLDPLIALASRASSPLRDTKQRNSCLAIMSIAEKPPLFVLFVFGSPKHIICCVMCQDSSLQAGFQAVHTFRALVAAICEFA